MDRDSKDYCFKMILWWRRRRDYARDAASYVRAERFIKVWNDKYDAIYQEKING